MRLVPCHVRCLMVQLLAPRSSCSPCLETTNINNMVINDTSISIQHNSEINVLYTDYVVCASCFSVWYALQD